MSKRPLFSSYSQGENRVTGSMIAVFERLDLSTLEQILRGATGESSLELVRFDLVKPEGAGTVPDGRIAASFKYLFEVKTAYDSLRASQLEGHLDHLDEGPYAEKRLFVLTPDAEQPQIVSDLKDDRVRWFSFADLNRSIEAALSREGVPDDERVLLRELQVLFSQEGLLGRQDVVVVAARHAYGFYLDRSAYVCQAGRAFRPGLARLGFYRNFQIEAEFPQIMARVDNVEFVSGALQLPEHAEPFRVALEDVVHSTLNAGSHVEGHPYQVFLLSHHDDDATITLREPIRHPRETGKAWTMGQRYIHSDTLRSDPATTDDLAGRAAGTTADEEL
jgi:hypothetical protein